MLLFVDLFTCISSLAMTTQSMELSGTQRKTSLSGAYSESEASSPYGGLNFVFLCVGPVMR